MQISDAVADAYLVDWSLSPDSTPDDDQADSSCRVEGELRAAPDTVGIMIIIVRRSDGFAINGTSPNEEAKQGAKASMEAPCVPASPHEVAGPYYFAATCSRMAKRPARSVTVLVEDGNAVHVSAMIDRPVDDVELQRVLEEASTGTADAVLRLM